MEFGFEKVQECVLFHSKSALYRIYWERREVRRLGILPIEINKGDRVYY